MIILDEPCSGLDPGAREQFLATLHDVLQRPNCPTMVMITHHIEEILPATKRVLVMESGKIIRDGTPEEIVIEETLQQIYGTAPAKIELQSGRRWPIW